jgi:SAM-dependent methyltransferase
MSDERTWDDEADTFDDAPDHGLRHPATRQAWTELLLPLVGSEPARVADLGCGTGTLSVLLAERGHRVSGVDFSVRMIELATEKGSTAGVDATFVRGDASDPPLSAGEFDVVLSRHVLWAMPDPASALRNWISLLRPGGRLVLVEGRWHTGAGLPADDARELVHATDLRSVELRLLDDPQLWGADIIDERYLLTARR